VNERRYPQSKGVDQLS